MAASVQKADDKRARNIRPVEPDALVWDSSSPAASLKKIGDAVEAEAATAYEWYWKQKRWKRIPSQWIQFNAVLLTALAGLAPIVLQVWKNFKGGAVDTGPIASLCVGLAAALLGIDKAFGFSTGWVRYVMAATAITKLLQEFRMDWVSLRYRRRVATDSRSGRLRCYRRLRCSSSRCRKSSFRKPRTG